MLDGQHYEFLSVVLSAVALIGRSEPDNPRYTFHVAYWNVKTSGC